MSLRVPTADLLRWIADTRALLDRLERGLAPQETSGETIDLWFERWNADRSKRGHDAGHEQLTYRRWIRPRLGELRVTGQLRGPVDDWVHWIEGRVEEGALHSTTAWRVQGLWLLLTVTPAPEPFEPPGVVLVAQGSRQKCEVVRARLLDETPTLC